MEIRGWVDIALSPGEAIKLLSLLRHISVQKGLPQAELVDRLIISLGTYLEE